MLKANVDASLGAQLAGIGYVIFKDEQVIYKRRQRVPLTDSNNLEYIALLSLLKTINQLGIKNVIINTDCKNIYRKIGLIGSGISIDDATVRDIIYELTVNPSLKVQWISREDNTIAHDLCRDSMFGLDDMEYIDPVLEIKNQIRTARMNKIIRYKKHLIKHCPCCKEYKAATEFPRYRKHIGMKSCSVCNHNLDQIQYGYIKTKNTY
jgi:ribonuclease HI